MLPTLTYMIERSFGLKNVFFNWLRWLIPFQTDVEKLALSLSVIRPNQKNDAEAGFLLLCQGVAKATPVAPQKVQLV